MIPMARPVVDDRDLEAVARILRSGYWASGPEVRAFEEEFARWINVKHAVAVTNGTVALHAALLAVGTKPGDLILTTPFTFIATTNSILFCQAKPEFVDVDPNTFLLDLDQVEVALKTKPYKAVLVVHLFGQMCDMPRLRKLCDQAGVALIEDCAQSHGATYTGVQAGTLGDVGTFSFYATKNLATGEGGMVTTQNDQKAALLRQLINHGRTGGYEHGIVGFNYRMTNIIAALGRTQMAHVDAGNERRRSIAARYAREIQHPDLRHPKVDPQAGHVFHQYTLRCSRRTQLQEHLQKHGISSAIIYPLLSYQQQSYLALGLERYHLPCAEKLVDEVLSIPVFPALSEQEIQHIIDTCNGFPSV